MSISSEPKHCPKCQTPLPGDAPQGLCPKCLLAAAAIPTEAGQPAPDKTPPSLAELAAAFPQLEILELIGQGGMGFVFKARQPKLDRFVALKILPQSLAADPAFAERFSREGRVLAKLNHPNIVTIHDFGVTNPQPSTLNSQPFYYLLMEFVDGVNLRQAMRAGRFTPDQALAIVPKICEALQFAHNEGILHRDIKPENILLDAKGRVKIADFGIAKLVGTVAQTSPSASSGGVLAASSEEGNTGLGSPVNPQAGKPALQPDALTEAGKALGTPNYMAPEQRECSGEVDQRADIYSLGVVFYEMLTGELPLGRFAPPSQKSAADPRVDKVVLRALEKEKAKRYASADEVKTQVETIASTPGSAGVPPAEPGVAPGSRETSMDERADGATPSAARGTRALPEPRFSRTAIVGACWAGFFVLSLLAFIILKTIQSGPAGMLFFFTLLPMGATAPFGATILGWVAVSQIRRSAGKLYGMWLAVFDGLLFPLLALNLLIGWLVWVVLAAVASMLMRNGQGTPSTILAILLSLPIAIPLNQHIIRRVWRAVNKPDGTAPAKETAENASDAGKNASRAGHAFLVPLPRNRFWKWLIVTVLAAILIPIAIKVIWLALASVNTRSQHAATISSGPTRTLKNPPFVARLNQAEVELVAVGNQPWTNPVCWLPNGHPSAKPFPTGNGSTEQWAENMDVKKIAFYIRNESAEGVSCPVCRVGKESGAQPASSGWDAPDKRRPNGYFGQIIVCPSNTATMNISLGVANGAWETATTLRSGLGGSGSANGEWSATYQAVAGGSEVAVGYTYSKNADWESRMAYVDGDGKVIPIQENSSHVGDTQQTGATLLVSSNEFAHIKEFRLQRRKYQWAEFRNVSLQPGHATTVTVQDFGGANASPPVAQKLSFDAFVERVRRELSRASIRFDKLHISAVNADNFIVSFSGLEAHGVSNGKDAWLPITGSVGSLAAKRVFFGDKWDFKGLNQLAVVRFTVADLDLEKLLETNLAEAMPAAPAAAPNLSFGPVIERVIQARQTGTNSFLNLGTSELLTPPAEVTNALAAVQPTDLQADNTERRWQGLDILENTQPFRYIAWLRESGADLMFNGNGQIIAFEGNFAIAHGESSANWDDWSGLTPAAARAAVAVVGSATQNANGGTTSITLFTNSTSTTYTSAQNLFSRHGGSSTCLLTREQSTTWFFKTRQGRMGILQITGFTENPRGVKIRYKLVQQPSTTQSP